MFLGQDFKGDITKSEAGILEMVAWIAIYSSGSLISKLKRKQFDKAQIMMMVYDVREYSARLSKMYCSLLNLSQTYNNLFASDLRREQLDGISKRFENLNEAVTITNTVFSQYKSDLPMNAAASQRIHVASSLFVDGEITLDIIECVRCLCDEIEEYYQLVLGCLKMCRSLAQEERRLLDNLDDLEELYNECFDNAWEALQATIELIDPKNLTEEEKQRAKECCQNFHEFLVKNFHRMNNAEFMHHVMAVKYYRHQMEKELMIGERFTLFPADSDRERNARAMIAALDSLGLETRKSSGGDKLQFTTLSILALKDALGYDGEMETFIRFLGQNYHGKIGIPKPSALSIERSKENTLSLKTDSRNVEKWAKTKRTIDRIKMGISNFMDGLPLDDNAKPMVGNVVPTTLVAIQNENCVVSVKSC